MLSRQDSRKAASIFEKYNSAPAEIHAAVEQWENGTCDTISYKDESGNTIYVPGTAPGGPNIGKPVFQYKTEPRKTFGEGGLMVAESSNCVSFIPGGFRDAPTVNTMNPVREEIGGNSALMSLVHVVTIPKDIRIFNAATLTSSHESLLKEMKDLGEKAIDILINGPKEMIGSLKWVYAQSGSITMNDGTQKSILVTINDLSLGSQSNFGSTTSNDIRNSFHVYPCASIAWLHLHTYAGNLLTKSYDSQELYAENTYGCAKNTSYDKVLSSIH